MTATAQEQAIEQEKLVPVSVKTAGATANELIKGLKKTADDATLKPEDQDPKPITDDIPAEDIKTAPPELKKPEKKQESEDYKQKYSVLQGKYNAEIPRLNAQVHNQAKEIARLNDEAKTLKAAGNVNAGNTDNKQKLDDVDLDDDINPEDFEEYGDEIVKLAKQNKSLLQKIDSLQKSVGSVEEDRKKTAEERSKAAAEQFYADMVTWDDVNNDPAFLTWLKTDIHPSYGVPRYSGFAQAVNQFNNDRVISIFKEFKSLSPETKQTPPKQKQVPKNIQPTKRPADNGSLDADGARLWTPNQIKAHYSEKTKGLWKGREAEWKQLETDLLSAQGQGRVRPD